jgi:hypothetical protein
VTGDVLAGPILRRSDQTGVWVWLATETEASFYGTAYETRSKRNGQLVVDRDALVAKTDAPGSGGHRQCQLGERLFVHLVHIAATAEKHELPTGPLLAYDIVDKKSVEGAAGGWSLGELAKQVPLATAGLDLPSFMLQRPDVPLRALFGSCRKFHGDDEDAMVAAELYLAEKAQKPDRPTALFLLGDQIYADDVPKDVLEDLARLSRHLLGYEESIPGVAFTKSGSVLRQARQVGDPPDDVVVVDFPTSGMRQEVLNACGFSSREAENHLMRFSEWAACYLLAWNQGQWTPPANGGSGEKSKTREAVKRFWAALPAVRRLLANVPTYMMFDDHEITDDWNRVPAWRKGVEKSPTGRRVIANGLAAYWAFQAWGNDPDAFQEVAAPLTAHLVRHPAKDPRHSLMEALTARRYEDTLLRFGSKGDGWSFVAPTKPPTLFVDCRTRRGDAVVSIPNTDYTAPILLAEQAWESLKTRLRNAGFRSNQPLVIVLGTPFYNLPTMELFQGILSTYNNPMLRLGPDQWDLEVWTAAEANRRDMIYFLTDPPIPPSVATILSGDVHYASAAAAVVTREDKVKIAQFTSSALKNPFRLIPWVAANLSSVDLKWKRVDFAESVYFIGSPKVRPIPPRLDRVPDTVSDSNVGLLEHTPNRIRQSILVPDRSRSAEPARNYHRALECEWQVNDWPARPYP